MLNVERLRALHAVARHGSILGAADELRVTTSAVSQQLAKLEREVGRPLLEKQGRGVRLTDAAHRLVAHTEPVFSMLEQAEAELGATRDGVAGPLHIAGFATSVRGLFRRDWIAAPRLINTSETINSPRSTWRNSQVPCRPSQVRSTGSSGRQP